MKNVRFSLCTSACTKVFTLWSRSSLKENAIPEPKAQKQRNSNHKNGKFLSQH